MEKICTKCNQLSNQFDKDRTKKDGYHPACKECRRRRSKIYYINNRDDLKNHQLEYYNNNKEARLKYSQVYYRANKDKLQPIRTKYQKTKRKNDINFKIAHNLRSRLRGAIKKNTKLGSAVKDLGCSIEELKHYLAERFTEGMTWQNYGEWEIDHIKPLSKFDLTNREELLKACNYNNLQPLWKIANRKKRNKY